MNGLLRIQFTDFKIVEKNIKFAKVINKII